MRGLPIRQPYIDMILDGQKTWEMRKSRCNFRERIALIQSGSLTVVGVADVVDCIGPLTDEKRFAAADKHCLAPAEWSNPKFMDYRFAWVLTNVQRLSKPVPYRHPSGAVIWVTLDDTVAQQLAASSGHSLTPTHPLHLPLDDRLQPANESFTPITTTAVEAIFTPAPETDVQVPFAKDGSFIHSTEIEETSIMQAQRKALFMRKLDRIATENLLLEFTDRNLDEAGLAAKRDEVLSLIAANTQIKVQEKCDLLFNWIQSRGKLNNVIARTIRVLVSEGYLIFGNKGNLYQDLLMEPYSDGTAKAQAAQMSSMLPMLKIVFNDGNGRFVPNQDSLLLMRLKVELQLDENA
jgi:hypothetical protein